MAFVLNNPAGRVLLFVIYRVKKNQTYSLFFQDFKATNLHSHVSNLCILLQSLCSFDYISSIRGSRISLRWRNI